LDIEHTSNIKLKDKMKSFNVGQLKRTFHFT